MASLAASPLVAGSVYAMQVSCRDSTQQFGHKTEGIKRHKVKLLLAMLLPKHKVGTSLRAVILSVCWMIRTNSLQYASDRPG